MPFGQPDLIVLVLLPVRSAFNSIPANFDSRRVVWIAGPALVLSIFSLVGFESATTLGARLRNRCTPFPRGAACALLAGVFFMLCAYSEVLGFRGQSGRSRAPPARALLAAKAGISPLGVAIDCGAFISMFACVLACATAAARV